MMSVKELFYGNQTTPTRILRGSPSQVKHQQSPFGTRSPFSHDSTFLSRSPFAHDSTFLRDDHDAVQQAHGRNHPHASSLNFYTSRYQQDSRLPADSRYASSPYISSTARDYDDSPARMGVNHLRTNVSTDNYSSPNYSRHSSRGGNSNPASTWVELRVPVCCEDCVERLNSHLLDLGGVESITCDQRKQRVVVRGTAAACDVLKVCKKLFKRSEYWRYQYDWL